MCQSQHPSLRLQKAAASKDRDGGQKELHVWVPQLKSPYLKTLTNYGTAPKGKGKNKR